MYNTLLVVLKAPKKKKNHSCSSFLKPAGKNLLPVVGVLRNHDETLEALTEKFSSDCIGAILDLISSHS